MLKQLHISNLILIETSEVIFDHRFNVLSGETGAGKSAIMDAINLIAGGRADSGMIRKGAEKGIIEALFDIEKFPTLREILEDAGIDHERGEDLIIRREINVNGKNRSFVNNQPTQTGLLRTIGELLIEIVGQHANQKLLSIENHRNFLDLFGNLKERREAFGKSWEEELQINNSLSKLIKGEAQRLREIETCRMELKEIEEAHLEEDEEERLFQEYALLSNASQLSEKIEELFQGLSGGKISALEILNKQKNLWEQLQKLDASTFSELNNSYQNALIELQEIAHTLAIYQSNIENDPEKIAKINNRLSFISKLKRKYGPTVKEIHAYYSKLLDRLQSLEGSHIEIEQLITERKQIEEKNHKIAASLTKSRKHEAAELEKFLTDQLKSLNMPKTEFSIDITSQDRCRHGDDRVEFFLVPNVGENRIPIRECASGGELSRLMLALQTLLAGKKKIPTLIFDEIDANIGGETAAVIGQKLREIGKQHQVLCITHFSQVAAQADHHLQITKNEHRGRTFSTTQILDSQARKKELQRMRGESCQRTLKSERSH